MIHPCIERGLKRSIDWVPRPSSAWAGLCLFVLLVFSLTAFADKKSPTGYPTRHGDLLIDIEGLAVTAPERNCENWAWAAALQTVLRAQKVELPQSHFVDRANGGRCEDSEPTLEETDRLIEREYRNEDGTRLRVTTKLISGAPRVIDELLTSLAAGRPVLLYWRSHAYVLQGILYDEAVYPTGNKLYEARELRLLDPAAPGSPTKFVRGSDNADEINGMLIVTVEL